MACKHLSQTIAQSRQACKHASYGMISSPLYSLPFGNAAPADQERQRFLPQRLVGHPEESAEDQVPGEARENHDWLPSTLLTWSRLHNKKKAQSSPPPGKVSECAFSSWLCGSANQDRPGIVLSSAPVDSPDNRAVACIDGSSRNVKSLSIGLCWQNRANDAPSGFVCKWVMAYPNFLFICGVQEYAE